MTKKWSEMTPQEKEARREYDRRRYHERKNTSSHQDEKTKMMTETQQNPVTVNPIGTGMPPEKTSGDQTPREDVAVQFQDQQVDVPKLDIPSTPKEEAKSGKGRPPKPFKEPYHVPDLWCQMMLDMMFQIPAYYFGTYWVLTDDELKLNAEAWNPVADEYINEWFKKNPAFAVALITTGITIAGKLTIQMGLRRGVKHGQPAASPGDARSSAGDQGKAVVGK